MDTSHLAEHAGAAGSFFASIFVVATLSMRTMIPLRVFAILTNIVLLTTAIPTHNYPTLILHTVLLPLNVYRLHQMLQLVRNVKKSVNSDLSMEWLKPFMTERKCKAGEVLFYKDEKAESMYYIVSGRYRLVESGIELPVGAIVGEFGMLSPSNVWRSPTTGLCSIPGSMRARARTVTVSPSKRFTDALPACRQRAIASATAANTSDGDVPRATSVATRRNAACCSASILNSS